MKNIKLYRWSPITLSPLSAYPHFQWFRRMVLRDLGMKHAEFGTLDATETLTVLNAIAWAMGRRKYLTKAGIEETSCYIACDLIQLAEYRDAVEFERERAGEL